MVSRLFYLAHMKRIIIIALLSPFWLIGNATTWTSLGVYDTSWYDDLSTSFDIENEKELAGFAFLCNNGTSFANKTINLVSDMDLSENEWEPILIFEGIFNGNFHAINNFHIDYHDDLFGTEKAFFIHNSGSIVNLELQGSVLLASRGYGEISAGGLCLKNEGTISDCVINCTVSAYNENAGPSNGYNHNAGGICVLNKGFIFNCVNLKDVSAKPSVYDYRARINCAGGIAGQNEGEIINCLNYGDIYTSVGYDHNDWKVGWGLPWGYSGGICGYNSGNISNCVSIANVISEVVRLGDKDGTNSYAGGIVANNSGTITDTYYSSAKLVSAPQIMNEGLKLGQSQLNNTSYDFTGLLNQNVKGLSNNAICFWANSQNKNNNIPFHLNEFAFETQVIDIMQSRATFIANPIEISASIIKNKGFEYRKQGEYSYKKVYSSDKFTATVVNLELSAIYEVRAFVFIDNGETIRSSEVTFSTSKITVETENATDVTSVSATLKGSAQCGNTAIKSQGFLWKTESEDDYNAVYAEGQNFEYTLNNLSPNTTYCYQAFVLTIENESVYGNRVFFSTLPVEIFINKNTIIDCNSILLKGQISINTPTDVTIEYKRTTDDHYDKKRVKSSDDGYFECYLSELSSNTEYECRAYIIYNNILVYSGNEIYKTLGIQVQTLEPIVDTSVLFRGEIIGKSNKGVVGFEYRDASYPDLISSKTIYSNLTNQLFTSQINDVTNGKEYKYRAFYQDENKDKTYGEWIYFTPTSVVANINNTIKASDTAIYYDMSGKIVEQPLKGIFIVLHSNGEIYTIIK